MGPHPSDVVDGTGRAAAVAVAAAAAEGPALPREACLGAASSPVSLAPCRPRDEFLDAAPGAVLAVVLTLSMDPRLARRASVERRMDWRAGGEGVGGVLVGGGLVRKGLVRVD